MPTTNTRKPVSRSKKASSTEPTEESNSQLEKFFVDQLKDVYWAEKHLLKALPKMQKAATSSGLQQAIEEHIAQTEEQASRLEQIFEMMGQKAQAKKCDGMEGLVKEGESVIEETEKGSMTRDAGIIMSAQKVEHYEIAAYGTLVQLATIMGLQEAAELLETTLEEEKTTDENLTALAEESVNWKAASETEGDSDESEEE